MTDKQLAEQSKQTLVDFVMSSVEGDKTEKLLEFLRLLVPYTEQVRTEALAEMQAALAEHFYGVAQDRFCKHFDDAGKRAYEAGDEILRFKFDGTNHLERIRREARLDEHLRMPHHTVNDCPRCDQLKAEREGK